MGGFGVVCICTAAAKRGREVIAHRKFAGTTAEKLFVEEDWLVLNSISFYHVFDLYSDSIEGSRSLRSLGSWQSIYK